MFVVDADVPRIVLPKLSSVSGAFHVDTSAQKFDCASVENLKEVKGEVTCHFNDPNPQRSGSDGSGGDSDSGDDGSGAGSVNVPLFMAAVTVLATMASVVIL